MNIFNNKSVILNRTCKNTRSWLFKLIILILSFNLCFVLNTNPTNAAVNLTDNPLLNLSPEPPSGGGGVNLTDNPLLDWSAETPTNNSGNQTQTNTNSSVQGTMVQPAGTSNTTNGQNQSSQPGGLPSYYDQSWSVQTNQQSPVITPGQQPQGMLDQRGPQISESCGISPANGKWNYCLLAPLNGLIGEKIGSGNTAIERFDISDGLGPFFSKVYRIGIMAAIGLSIVMISLGGIQLATTDTIQGTDSGRKRINAAFAGLFIALFSYVLLYTINPALVNNGAGSVFERPTIAP